MRIKSLDKARSKLSMDPQQDADMKRVMAYTSELVEQALQANWLAVLEGIDSRRRLLQTIVEREPETVNPQVSALSEAVSESERALMRVVAHAVASSRVGGSSF